MSLSVVPPIVPSLVQYTARSWTIALAGDGVLDLTTANAAHLLVHRVPPPLIGGGETIETWAASISSGATPTLLTLLVQMLGHGTGPNYVPTALEGLRVRPYLSFPGGPDVEFASESTQQQLKLVVTEA